MRQWLPSQPCLNPPQSTQEEEDKGREPHAPTPQEESR